MSEKVLHSWVEYFGGGTDGRYRIREVNGRLLTEFHAGDCWFSNANISCVRELTRQVALLVELKARNTRLEACVEAADSMRSRIRMVHNGEPKWNYVANAYDEKRAALEGKP